MMIDDSTTKTNRLLAREFIPKKRKKTKKKKHDTRVKF